MTDAERDAVVCTESYAGRIETRVKVLSETPKRYRVRYCENSVRRRAGEVVLVPKAAVRFVAQPTPDAPIDYSQLAFCEPVFAGSLSKWCIRKLTAKGLKPTGGVDTESLCGRVKPRIGGWDIREPKVTEELVLGVGHTRRLVCSECVARLRGEDT